MKYSISVIIPYFNNSDTIKASLDSLLCQTIPVDEVIIIDDFSKDQKELIKIISNYDDELPIKLLRNEQNRNGAYSRNRGILASTGEIIAFLDADDIWGSNKTIKIEESIKEYGADILFFSKVKIEINGILSDSRPNHFNPKTHISEYLFLEDGFIQTSSIFCSSGIAKSILFQEQFKRHQDYDFVLRAYHKGVRFHFIPEELTTYRSELKVNLSKGEAYTYSKLWSQEMRIYFSNSGYRGFQVFNLTARLIAEKRYIIASMNFIKSILCLNIVNYSRIYPKLKRIIKGLIIK